MVKFGMIAGAGNVVIFNRICSRPVRKVPLAARRVAVCVFWVGSCSDHARNGLGSVAHWKCHFRLILGGHFAWQAQYLVRLEGVACCSAHCK